MYFNLAKANIKSRKEAFIGTIILTMLIIMILTVVYCMKANVGKWIDQANEYASTGDLMVWIDSNDISDDNFKKLDNVSDVKSYDKIEAALVAGESKIYIWIMISQITNIKFLAIIIAVICLMLKNQVKDIYTFQ